MAAFNKIFKDHKELIKRNCFCCGGINIEKTTLPKDEEDFGKLDMTLAQYITYRFILYEEGNADICIAYPDNYVQCEAFDNIILGIYKVSSENEI